MQILEGRGKALLVVVGVLLRCLVQVAKPFEVGGSGGLVLFEQLGPTCRRLELLEIVKIPHDLLGERCSGHACQAILPTVLQLPVGGREGRRAGKE